MINAPYVPDLDFDQGLSKLTSHFAKTIEQGNDDALVIITGAVGTGKSNLGLHIISQYNHKPDIQQVALTRKQFAQAHENLNKQYRAQTPRRFIFYDEADLTSRNSMTEWNRDVLHLYNTNRILGGLHLWCNPSIEYLDKFFVQERIRGVFFVYTKDVNRPRKYYFFTKKAILEMLEANKKLTHGSLKKYAKKYAYYRGWFKEYKGPLLQSYMTHKAESASEISSSFYEKYIQGDRHSQKQAAQILHTILLEVKHSQ